MPNMQAPATAPAGAEAQAMWYGIVLGLLHALLLITRQVSARMIWAHSNGCLICPEQLWISLVLHAGVTMSSASLSFTGRDCMQ